MKKQIFLFTLLLWTSIHEGIFAQAIPKKLDSLLSRTLDSMFKVHKSKSLNVAIQFKNGEVWTGARGISHEVPFTPANNRHIYLIGSVVKTITSACVLQLADEKKISLDDPLHKWLDTLPYVNPNISIRQLLRHQSGIFDVLQHPQNQQVMLATKDSIWSYRDLIIKFGKPAISPPGQAWSYCNTNYFLLAMIIQKVTGKPYYQEFRSRFFEPNQFNSFKLPAHEGPATNVAHIWIDLNGDGIDDDAHNFYTTWKSLNAMAGSSGGYYATAADLSRWMRKYMRGDLLSPTMQAEARQTIVAPGQGLNYGLGLMERNFLHLKGYGHGGDLSYAASSWYFPEKDMSISVLCNDSKYTSWTLIPTVTELLRTYNRHEKLLVATKETEPNKPNATLQVFPNPIQDNSLISFELSSDVKEVRLEFINIAGARVALLTRKGLPGGKHVVNCSEIGNLPQGVYIVHLYLDGKLSEAIKVLQ